MVSAKFPFFCSFEALSSWAVQTTLQPVEALSRSARRTPHDDMFLDTVGYIMWHGAVAQDNPLSPRDLKTSRQRSHRGLSQRSESEAIRAKRSQITFLRAMFSRAAHRSLVSARLPIGRAVAQRRWMTPAPKAGETLMERRADRELPSTHPFLPSPHPPFFFLQDSWSLTNLTRQASRAPRSAGPAHSPSSRC